MEKIQIIPKPEWISWEDIYQLLIGAHKKNIEKGMSMKIVRQTPEELPRILGDKGRCYVALSGDKLVGTSSVSFQEGKHWYDRGMLVAHGRWSGILKEYQGAGILGDLSVEIDKYIKEVGADVQYGDTAENNKVIRKYVKNDGFVEVGFHAYKSKHYSVLFVKWLKGNPYPLWYCHLRCKLSEWYVKIRYKVGGVKRFGI